MKGIILAGGAGTRLYPVTRVVCKQLLPIYDKPMVYYPLSTLMLAGIREILVISTPEDIGGFERLFGDGSHLGLSFSYRVQDEPRGIAEALIIGEEFIGNESVCLILGDNIFFGHNLSALLKEASGIEEGAVIFGYWVKDPERYGVVEFDDRGNALGIEEKPAKPRSHYAVVGLYFYDSDAPKIARSIRPSGRGEIEITDVNREYLRRGKASVKLLGRGYAWLDTGTHSSLVEAIQFVKTIEDRQGLKIACIEEIAYRMGYIGETELRKLAVPLEKSGYGEYLLDILESEKTGGV
ncbi:MAG: glucose-1-phosphate thymidylyltransferase RfbA [Spirochaetes bacterium]|nr:glucose-1-phosphate thymidylyltransferase RfbA [Spirochaetota bacterium]